MTKQIDSDDAIWELLRRTIRKSADTPERDLWPAMLDRFDRQSQTSSWMDWALAGVLLGLLAISPGAIPFLLYQL
jgi:hypothetical protein